MSFVLVPLALFLVAGAQPPDAAPAPRADDEKAIRAADEAFVRAYNRADSKALAALFTEDAEVVEADGTRYEGRALIEQSFTDTFTHNKGAKLAIEIASIRFIGPDVAKEEGRSQVVPASGGPVTRLYTVLYARRDGRWLIASEREEPDPFVGPHDRLEELAWMIGDWVDEGADSLVRLSCRWSEDGNFLIRSFSVKHKGKPVMSVVQRIGWDPLAGRFRSWEFDSEGGYGEGTWSRDGDRWVVKHTGVRPEGTTASATNTMIRERPDRVRWASTDRVVGDESTPADETYVLVRVPPPPRTQAAKTPTSTSTPTPGTNPARSPR